MTQIFNLDAEISSKYKQMGDKKLLGPVLANVTMRPGAGTMYCMALCNTWGNPTGCEHGNVIPEGVCELLGFTVGLPAEIVQPGIVSFTRITSKTAGKCNDIQEVNTMFHLCLNP